MRCDKEEEDEEELEKLALRLNCIMEKFPPPASLLPDRSKCVALGKPVTYLLL